MKRMFVALDLPDKVKLEIESSLASAKAELNGIAWVRPEGMHLTLRFLGNVDHVAEIRMKAELSEVAREHGPFKVSYAGIGSFGKNQSVSVVWVGAKGFGTGLKDLANDIEAAARACGFPADTKGFSPHLTLGRVRDGTLLPPWDVIEKTLDWAGGEILHEEFCLFSSTLAPGGSIYAKEASYRLEKR